MADDILSVDALKHLLEDLFEVRAKWYNIGLQLGVPAGTLDSVRSADDGASLREMLKWWLRQGEPPATGLVLVNALSSRTVGEGRLARQLATREYLKITAMPGIMSSDVMYGRHLPLTPYNSLEPTQANTTMIARVQQSTIDPHLLRDRMQQLAISEGGDSDESPTHDHALAFIQSQKYDVFLSYASADEEFAKEVRQRLVTHAKLNVFVPSQDLMPGNAFSQEIADKIVQGCRKTVVILSPDYIRSEWCEYESGIALQRSPAGRERILIPILYRKCKIPVFIRHLYHLEYTRFCDDPQECELYFWNRLYKSLTLDTRRQ